MWSRTKRLLYMVHRWIGIATCLLFVMWFASGLVMLHVPFPSLDGDERLAGLNPIRWAAITQTPSAFVQGAVGDAKTMTIEMRGDRPIWRISPWASAPYAVWADGGGLAGPASRAEASSIARAFARADLAAIRPIESDQWTVASRYDAHRPLWKAELEGSGGRVVYVSSMTGAVVLETDRHERFWNWVGSVPHWLYVRALREDQSVWRQVVLWSAGPCIVVAITGIWIGLMRVRTGKRRFKGGRMTPYHGWMKWHHISGLAGSAFLILWIFSGWLSVDPGRLFASPGIGIDAQREYAGRGDLPLPDLAHVATIAPNARRVTVQSAAGQAFVRIEGADGKVRLLDADDLNPLRPDMARITESVAKLVPQARVSRMQVLTGPDAYWYSVKGPVALPVLRVSFDDPARTWVHLRPATGEIVGESDTSRRTYRWLFDLLHRWDAGVLLRAWPARELLVWLASLVGLAGSASAVVVGWRRLRRSW